MISCFLNKYFRLGFEKVLNDYKFYQDDKRKMIKDTLLIIKSLLLYLPLSFKDKEVIEVRARSLLKNAIPFIISFILGYITNSSYVLLSCFLFSFVIAFFQEKYLQEEIDKIEKQINELNTKKRASNLYIKTRNF